MAVNSGDLKRYKMDTQRQKWNSVRIPLNHKNSSDCWLLAILCLVADETFWLKSRKIDRINHKLFFYDFQIPLLVDRQTILSYFKTNFKEVCDTKIPKSWQSKTEQLLIHAIIDKKMRNALGIWFKIISCSRAQQLLPISSVIRSFTS
jgi:hypothetical protein